jgi:predicted lipoprotein with Yx(FWY)xxD motif
MLPSTPWRLITALVVVIVVLACAAPAQPTGAPPGAQQVTPSPSPQTPQPAATQAVVRAVAHSQLGTILVDGNGQTLYLFTRDERNRSNCTDRCAQIWPPLTTTGAPTAGDGAVSGLLGTITRPEGTMQVTYNGWPLYRYSQDTAAGDVKGQNVNNIWFVVSTYGGPILTNATIRTSQHQLGTLLTDASGRVLYLFTRDEPNRSNCVDRCAQLWPPVITVGAPSAGEGANAGLLGTITRAEGYTQVTYNGKPLYYYAQDEKPGDARGQNFNNVWFVVSATGEAIMTAP